MKKTMGILTILLGIISCIMFFQAGSHLNDNGKEMKQLKSQGGTSLAEAYYQDIGEISKGLGSLCYAFGFGSLAISIGIGGNLYQTENKIVSRNNVIELGENDGK
jgi:hypothetical protein